MYEERGGHVGFGNTEEAAHAVVLGRRERGAEAPGKRYNRHTGEGYVAPVAGDYARARAAGVTCVPLLVETFGGFGTLDSSGRSLSTLHALASSGAAPPREPLALHTTASSRARASAASVRVEVLP